MKKLSNDELNTLAKAKIPTDDATGYAIREVWKDGYQASEDKHLKTIARLQKILKSHRVVIETMYSPTVKK